MTLASPQQEARLIACPRYMAPIMAERPATGQPLLAQKQGEVGFAGPQPASLPRRERERRPLYASGNESERSLASDAELGHSQGAAFGCVGSCGKSERETPLPSVEAKSTSSAARNETEIATSDESRGAVPKLGTSARVTGGAGEKRRVHFATRPHIIGRRAFPVARSRRAASK